MFSFASKINTDNIDHDDPGLRSQAKKLMSMIDYAIRCLGNLDELVPKLKTLGKRHFVKYNVKPEHFKVWYHWMIEPPSTKIHYQKGSNLGLTLSDTIVVTLSKRKSIPCKF